MTIALAILAAALLAALVRVVLQSRVLKDRLASYGVIADAERYLNQCQQGAQTALTQRDQLLSEFTAIQAGSEALKKEVSQYRKVVADFKSASRLQQYVQQMSAYAEGCKTLGDLHARIEQQTRSLSQLAQDIERLGYVVKVAMDTGDLQSQIEDKRAELSAFRQSILAAEDEKRSRLTSLQQSILDAEKEVARYREEIGDFKTATELQEYIKKKSAYADGCWTLESLQSKIEHHTHLASQLAQDIERLGPC